MQLLGEAAGPGPAEGRADSGSGAELGRTVGAAAPSVAHAGLSCHVLLGVCGSAWSDQPGDVV